VDDTSTSSDSGETGRVRGYYDRLARDYDSWTKGFDRIMLGAGRSRVCSRARGQTLEIAVGTGLNLPYYPPDVTLTGVDLSPAMLAYAQRRAQDLNLDVRFELGDAQALAFPDAVFDTVTSTLFMSTVPGPHAAAGEMRRVLKPGGRVLLLDFARSPLAAVRWFEQAVAPVTARSHFSLVRDPLDYLEAVGFTLEHVDRFRLGIIEEVVARNT
jgi:ubiquinone/menaquinone biosynthesis C-methylase UbiE